MDYFRNLTMNAQIVLVGALLFLLFSFFDWQSSGGYGVNMWHGFFGVAAGLVVFVLIAWELARAMKLEIAVGDFSPGLVSLVIAVLLLVLTIGAFLDKDLFRAWPAYVGLILGFVIAFFAFRRSREEGVEMPKPSASAGPSGGDGGGTSV